MAEQITEPKLDRYSKENRWYYKTIDNHISLEARKLLEVYSDIPIDEINSHIYTMRDKLWSHAPYPCVGEFKFLTLNLLSHPLYQRILKKIGQPATSYQSSPNVLPPDFLDLGCCVAQELRSLVHSGVPSRHLYGSDLNPHFLSTSYDLFKDKDTFKGTLVRADIFSPKLFDENFKGWENKFAVIHAGLFLHLFSWEQQIAVCCTIAKLLNKNSDSLFVGEMVGCSGGGERDGGKGTKFWKKGEERKQFLHDEESFQGLWDEVAEQTGTVGKWKVDGIFKARKKNKDDPTGGCAFFTGEGIGWFIFSVEWIR